MLWIQIKLFTWSDLSIFFSADCFWKLQFSHCSLEMWFILVHFVPSQEKINPVFVFRRVISNFIFDEILQIFIWLYDHVYHQYVIVQSHFNIQMHYLRCKTLLFQNLAVNLLSWNEWRLCETEVVNVDKEAGICFVLPETCVLRFYWEGQTMLCTHS